MSYQSDNMAFNSAMDSLSHYGVLGMKWGVRNADTLRKYEGPQGGERRKTSFSERAETRVTKSGKQIAPASKRQVQRENQQEIKGFKSGRQATKTIKKTAKAYKRAEGKRNTLGSNMAELDKKVSKIVENDAEYKRLSADRDALSKKLDKLDDQYTDALVDYENASSDLETARSIYDQAVSGGATGSIQEYSRRDFVNAVDKADSAKKKQDRIEKTYNEAYDKYQESVDKLTARGNKIISGFRNEYLDAGVKDLGFSDVEAGRALIKEYELEDMVINPSYLSRYHSKGVRNL